MYIYLTVSLIQILFFITYCSCLKRKKNILNWEEKFNKDIEYEENYQNVLDELKKKISVKKMKKKIY